MTGCCQDVEPDSVLVETLTGSKATVHGDVFGECKELVAQIVELEYTLGVPETLDCFEILALGFRHRQPDSARACERTPLGMVAMKMGVKHPRNLLDTE